MITNMCKFRSFRYIRASSFALASLFGPLMAMLRLASTHYTSINSRRPRFTSPGGDDVSAFGWMGIAWTLLQENARYDSTVTETLASRL